MTLLDTSLSGGKFGLQVVGLGGDLVETALQLVQAELDDFNGSHFGVFVLHC